MPKPDAPNRDRLAHLLWEVGARVNLLGEAALSRTPLSSRTAGMLETIAADPGTSIAEISRKVPASPQAVSQLVGRLEGMGYLERRSTERGRGVSLHITEAGAKAAAEADARKELLDREMAEALGEERHAELVRLLREARPILTAMERGA
jgi:MarR family transcriptional regulator, negative regulator of the multidrug operon emrRAB